MDHQPNQFLRSILYYPTIRISSRWLKQSILYWDKVCSIVPADRQGNEELGLDNDLQYLVGEQEFQPVSPEQFFDNWEGARSFTSELAETLDSPKFRRLLRTKKQFSFTSTIHKHKMNEEIVNILENHGLIHPADKNIHGEHRRWVRVENITAHVYMGILAKHISQINHFILGTDNAAYEDVIFAPLSQEDRKQAAQISLKKILPVPLENTPVQEIVAYKRLRRDELMRFRQLIDEIQRQLGECGDQDDVHQTLIHYDELIQQGKQDLETTLSEQGIQTTVGTLNVIAGISTSAALSWAASLVMNNSAVGTASFLGTGGIQILNHWVSQRFSTNKTLRDSPYSYLYHAEQEHITAHRRNRPA